MILQYKGFNNNWCYEEAETIIHANVYVAEITKKYKKDKLTVEEKQQLFSELDNFITQETQCADDIFYHIDDNFENLQNVAVITLKDKNKNITRVFTKTVYLLNNTGQTVQKLSGRNYKWSSVV